jgi:hypothetical protein
MFSPALLLAPLLLSFDTLANLVLRQRAGDRS